MKPENNSLPRQKYNVPKRYNQPKITKDDLEWGRLTRIANQKLIRLNLFRYKTVDVAAVRFDLGRRGFKGEYLKSSLNYSGWNFLISDGDKEFATV